MKIFRLCFIFLLIFFISCNKDLNNITPNQQNLNDIKEKEITITDNETAISEIIQRGGRAVVIKIDDENKFIASKIKKNSHIDIIGTFYDSKENQDVAITLLENTIVIDIDNKNITILTVYVLPQESEILNLAQKIGKLSISLRNDNDKSTIENKEKITVNSFYSGDKISQLLKKRRDTIQKIEADYDSQKPKYKTKDNNIIDDEARVFFIKISDENKYFAKNIKPFDAIDISVTYKDNKKNEFALFTILENIIVFETDYELTKNSNSKNTFLIVYCFPYEAQLLALAQSIGELNISMRTKIDLSLMEELSKTTINSIFTGDRIMEFQGIRKTAIQKVTIVSENGSILTGCSSNKTIEKKSINTDNKKSFNITENDFKNAFNFPLSTFSIDVDTGSYSLIRNLINRKSSVDKDIVRIEEMINYFDYDYLNPSDELFSINTETAKHPFDENKFVLSIGIQGIKKEYKSLPPANLVFLIDVSGSMDEENKLPFVKKGLLNLLNDLKENDFISIITYAEETQILIEKATIKDKSKIEKIINELEGSGGTNGENGLNKAYDIAYKNFIKDGINRIIACTDGDFNIGVQNIDSLKEKIKEKKKDGVSLSTIGFGERGYNDKLLEQIANSGDGNYSYVDSYNEMVKVLSTQLTSTFEIIAKDVKIQIEFNPKFIHSYKLIGYSNRRLNSEDFKNDSVDGGEIGAGHQVTALYEIIFYNDETTSQSNELKYQKDKPFSIKQFENSGEFAEIKVRYKKPDENKSNLVKHQLFKKDVINDISKTSNDFKFALSIAAFGQYLLKSEFNSSINLNDIISLATEGKGIDKFGYREEFIQLLKKYKY